MRVGFLFIVIVISPFAVFGGNEARINADDVNIRARPNTQVETVKPQLNEGDMVRVRKIDGEWAEIAPPDNADLYVYSTFVEDGVIQVSKLRVRSGPSVNHKDVGMVNKGDEVDVRGRFGEWLKIAPPEGSSLWVHTKFLAGVGEEKEKEKKEEKQEKEDEKRDEESDPEPERRTEPEDAERDSPPPPVRDESEWDSSHRPDRERDRSSEEQEDRKRNIERMRKPVVRSVKHTDQKKPQRQAWQELKEESEEEEAEYKPSDLDLIPLEGQGAIQEVEGELSRSGFRLFSESPAKYRLIVPRGNGFATVCYIKGNRSQLKALTGKRLKIKGRGYWVRGEDVPVIVPTRIVPLP